MQFFNQIRMEKWKAFCAKHLTSINIKMHEIDAIFNQIRMDRLKVFCAKHLTSINKKMHDFKQLCTFLAKDACKAFKAEAVDIDRGLFLCRTISN